MLTASHPHRSFAWGCSKRFTIGLRSGEDGGHNMSFSTFMPIAASDTEVFFATWDGALSCMKMILLRKARFFVPWKKVVSQKLYMLCHGNFHTFRDPKGAYQLSPHDSGPKHDYSTSLLTSQPCWDMVAIHQPSTTPSIWTIQSCMALISKQDCLKISLHVCVGPLQSFLLVRIG